MIGSLYELIKANTPAYETQDRICGIVTGTVIDINDPKNRGRVKVNFPWLCDEGQMQNMNGEKGNKEKRSDSPWAPVASIMAGAGRGGYFIPEPGDEVLVAFHNGDINRPYIIGSVWHEDAHPPEKMDSEGKNNFRSLVSRSGSKLQFDDTKDEEKILLKGAQQGKHYIVIEVTKGKEKIDIVDNQGGNRITLDTAANLITIESKHGNIDMKAPHGIFKVEARHVDIRAKGGARISAHKVSINARKSVEVASKGTMELESESSFQAKTGDVMTIQGSLVKIN